MEDDADKDNKSGIQVEEVDREVAEVSAGTETKAAPQTSTAGSAAPAPI